jgi:DNA-directed RNA polymerase subunit RPC12/RpoP
MSLFLAQNLDALRTYYQKTMILQPSIGCYIMICICVGIVAHWLVRNCFLAIVVTIIACHIIEFIMFVTMKHGSRLAIVYPPSIAASMLFSAPFALIIGIPFSIWRTRRLRNTKTLASCEEVKRLAPLPRSSIWSPNECPRCGENLIAYLLTLDEEKRGDGIRCPKCGTFVARRSTSGIFGTGTNS